MREILRILSNGGKWTFTHIGQVDAVCEALGIMPSAVEIMGVRANQSFSVRLKDGWNNAGCEIGHISASGNIPPSLQGWEVLYRACRNLQSCKTIFLLKINALNFVF